MRLDWKLLSLEAERKMFHTAWAILPLFYYFGYPHDGMLILTFSVLLIWSGIEIARKHGHSLISGGQMREYEKDGRVMGTFFQVLSLFLAVLLFDKTIAILAMLFCCVGDSVSGFVGAVLYNIIGAGRTFIRDYRGVRLPLSRTTLRADLSHALRHRKSVALMIVMLTTCILVGIIAYPDASLYFIAAGAAGAVVADAFAWRVLGVMLNDDLTITLAAGGALSLASLM
jgi:dolichol kinase